MRAPVREVMKHLWAAAVWVVKYRWPVPVLFGALWWLVDVSALDLVSRVLIGTCLVVGFGVSLILAESSRVRAASEQEGHGGVES